MGGIEALWQSMGIANLGWGQLLMMLVGGLLIFLAVAKNFEPLLLLPIGFGAILSNIPVAGIGGPDGLLGMVYHVGIETGVFPLLIFMGVGALTDFSALIAMPKTLFLGAAAQFGIFATLLGALALNFIPGFDFTLQTLQPSPLSAVPTGRRRSSSPPGWHLICLVPLLWRLTPIWLWYRLFQPPIMRALTTEKERQVVMSQLRPVSKLEKIFFPFSVLILCILFLPSAAPLIGMLMFGNILKETGVVERLSRAAQNEIINIVTIFLGLAVGSKLSADKFLTLETLGILALGAVAFCIGTATGVLMGKLMYRLTGGKVNPLIGAAGVSAVPMAARVVNKVGLEANHHNFLLMHAMGPNVAGVIGSAVAAGVLLALVGN